MELVRLEELGFQYVGSNQRVLHDVDLQIQSGEFLVLCGVSGCGKTTLLRQLKPAIAAQGQMEGRIYFHGTPLQEIDLKTQTSGIGFVSQNPEEQIVTDKVWHELAFGLESLGMENSIIQKRVAEMSHFFGIQEWFHQDTAQLSGGQKQLLNLAAVMVMQPEILLLDEPTSQLDPIAASDFIATLGRIHRELGTTILMTEHRLDDVIPICTRLLVMEEGTITIDGEAEEVAEVMRERGLSLFSAMPAPMRIWNEIEAENQDCPMTVQEGRTWFQHWADTHADKVLQHKDGLEVKPEESGKEETEKNGLSRQKRTCTLVVKDIWFRYDKKGTDILKGISLEGHEGELLAILGGNGCGKTTLLSMIHGGYKPQRGSVRFPQEGKQRVISLPQNPQLLFTEECVKEELEDMWDCQADAKKSTEEFRKEIEEVIRLCQLEGLSERHPYDLSGGEQQRLALAKILLTQPDILLLDEPTKGFDVGYKEIFAGILKQLTSQGVTILMVSHDVDFCAEYADRCMLMFDGQMVAEDTPRRFFSGNYFYTTNTNRMVRQILPTAVTVSQVIKACGGKTKQHIIDRENRNQNSDKTESNKRKPDVKDSQSMEISATEISATPNSIQKILAIGIPLLTIPVTIYVGNQFLHDEKYLFISLLILVEAMLPFVLVFEGRRPPARDLVLLSVFCALGVAGRGIFAMLPSFKPVTALTIIAGVAFGGETGFLVGAITMLVSNMLFGQGPWTPWQMFAMGMIGFLAGLLFHRKKKYQWKDKKKENGFVIKLCVYGFLATVLLYGGVMNLSTAILSGVPLNREVVAAYYLSGFPFDLTHGGATVLFLLLGAKIMLRRIERVKVKYGSVLV